MVEEKRIPSFDTSARSVQMLCHYCGSTSRTVVTNHNLMDKNFISYCFVVRSEKAEYSYTGEVCSVDCLKHMIETNAEHFRSY